MPRHKQPVQLAEIKGQVRKNPQRYQEHATNDSPVGDVPEHLIDAQQVVWHELVSMALPGVLTESDRIMLEIATVLLTIFRGHDAFTEKLTAAELNQLIGILGRLGMSPADRQKITLKGSEDKGNKFGEF